MSDEQATEAAQGLTPLERWMREERVVPAEPIARIRRGRRVLIPEAWRGKVTDRQTRRKRQSRLPRKLRRGAENGYPLKGELRLTVQERRAPQASEWDE